MTYVLTLYNHFDQRTERVLRVIAQDNWDHAQKYWRNESRRLKDWECYVVNEFDLDGLPTDRMWFFHKGN